MQNDEIQTRLCHACPVCGSTGSQLYHGLTDRLFDVPGTWSLSKCDNPVCGTLWLDPMPVEADLPKLYASYFTHQDAPLKTERNLSQYLLNRVRAAYVHARYGYELHPRPTLIDKLLGWIIYVYPAWKDGLDSSVFHLCAKPGGRLLEIGCGSGATLQSMQQKGWHVTGLDFDGGAVSNARSKGLDVRHGQLSAQGFADESFDVVAMSHVIEHVPSPSELLAECHRILKPGGVLVALTPNADSSLHRCHGRNWLSLDPPRHLQIFTSVSLSCLAARAGYARVETIPSMHGFIYVDLASAELAANEKYVIGGPVALPRRILGHIKALGFGWKRALTRGNDGEEIVLVCRK